MIDLPAVITSTPDLEQACAYLSQQPFITVDTEFLRQTTYRPKLCLIQMAGEGLEFAVDPLTGLDLSSFYALMANEAVVKVFHAARQDIEIIHQEAGIIPNPIFDSQIAAMALGHGEAISYGALVKKLLKRTHDKTYQSIDWCVRPLGPRQIEYALGDVTHLRDVYTKLKQRLEETGRESWLEEEVAVLTDPKTYAFDPADAWKRMKLSGKSRLGKIIIIELSAWRERTAQNENVPRGRVLKDEAIYEIAKHAPRSLDALSRLRTVRESVKARGEAILRCVATALAHDPAEIAVPGRARRIARLRLGDGRASACAAQGGLGRAQRRAEAPGKCRGPRKARATRSRRYSRPYGAGGGSSSAKRRWRSRPARWRLGSRTGKSGCFR